MFGWTGIKGTCSNTMGSTIKHQCILAKGQLKLPRPIRTWLEGPISGRILEVALSLQG